MASALIEKQYPSPDGGLVRTAAAVAGLCGRHRAVCDSARMRTVVALLLVAAAVAGCGGSAKPTATTGCKGVSTARRSVSFNSAAGQELLSRQATIAYVCAHFGPPERIVRAGRLVTWSYGGGGRAAALSFKNDRVVEGTRFDRGGPNATYEIQSSETVVSSGR
jgi:hypothetical protein